jgi:hypothetical protein
MDIDGLLLPYDSFDLFDTVTGKFARGGQMRIAREFHTATLLGDGTVLIAGGSECYATAELYDPVSGQSHATGSMTALRSGHTATLLNDGRVLVTGGSTLANGAVASAEIYDPASATFNPTGNMSVARYGHTATLLANGKVLIAGGATDNGAQTVISVDAVASAEIYDPQSGSFTLTGAMGTARVEHTATLLDDGSVLVAGGASSAPLATTELYDPQSGRFAPAVSMATPRSAQTATKLPDGKVLIVGGMAVANLYVGDVSTPTAGMYDPAGAGSFSLAGTMADSRFWHGATLLRDGRVLVAGGAQDDSDAIPRAETYP